MSAVTGKKKKRMKVNDDVGESFLYNRFPCLYCYCTCDVWLPHCCSTHCPSGCCLWNVWAALTERQNADPDKVVFFSAVWLNPSCGCSGLRYSQQIEHLRFLYYKPFSRGWRYKRIKAVLYPADYQGQQVLLSAETVVFCTHPHFLVFWCSWAELNYCREVVLLLSNSKLFLCNAGRLIKKRFYSLTVHLFPKLIYSQKPQIQQQKWKHRQMECYIPLIFVCKHFWSVAAQRSISCTFAWNIN